MSSNHFLSHRGYTGTCEVSIEDRCMHGRVLHIRDVISYGGDTFDEIEECFKQAVDGYLAHCEEVGKSPDKPYTGSFNVRVGEERHKKLIDTSIQLGKGLNETVNYMIDFYYDGSRRIHEAELHSTLTEAIHMVSMAASGTQRQFARFRYGTDPQFEAMTTNVYTTTLTQ